MTLNLQLPQDITLGMALQYAFIRILYSIILFMIEVIIRKKVLVFHSSNPKLEFLNYIFVFNSLDLPNTMSRIMSSTEHC